MKIPFLEFQSRVAGVFPDAHGQAIAPAPYVHVFDETWLQETFWPHWCAVKRAIDEQLPARPMTNSGQRGICDEINKRLIAELILSCRIANADANIAPGALEASVLIVGGLNRVASGAHRCAIAAVTKNGTEWRPVFIESQLSYADYETTDMLDAAGRGTVLCEHWM